LVTTHLVTWISKAVGIKKASIHHHFPKKEDLGEAVINNHLMRLERELQAISLTQEDSKAKLKKAFELILSVTYRDEKKMCLGGMLVSDMHTLPDFIQSKLKFFFDALIGWVNSVLGTQAQSELVAIQFVAMIEGALLLGRIYGIEEFTRATNLFVDSIKL
jgi:TetR/AcrR family transcriptional repressor of nem operon